MEGKRNSFPSLLGTALVKSVLKAKDGELVAQKLGLQRKREVVKILEPALQTNSHIESHIQSLDSALSLAVHRTGLLQGEKVKPRFEAAAIKEEALEQSLEHCKISLEQHPEVQYYEDGLQKCRDQVEALEKHESVLKQKVACLRQAARTERIRLDALKQQFKDLYKENMTLATSVMLLEEEKGKISRSVSRTEQSEKGSFSSLRPVSTTPKLDSSKTKQQIRSVRNSANRLLYFQSSYFLHIRTLETFFQSCLQASHKEFLRLQQLAKSTVGLTGSLYLESLQNQWKSAGRKPTKSRSRMSTRSYEDIIYDTVKDLVVFAKREKAVRQRSIQVIEDLKTLTPGEVLGLVLMTPDLQHLLHRQVFPTNTLCDGPWTTIPSPILTLRSVVSLPESERNRANTRG